MPRVCLVSPALALVLRAVHLRALHALFGGLDDLVASPVASPGHDPIAVARALYARELPDALVLALEEIERFATALGREALLEAARTRDPDFERLFTMAPVDLAVRMVLWSRRRTPRGRLARAITRRARVRVERYFALRASYEGMAPEPLDAGLAFCEALPEAARMVHGARLVAAWTETRGDVVYGAFVYEGHAERPPRLRRGVVAAPALRPLLVDRVRYDAKRGRLGFLLAHPSDLPAFRAAVGRAAFGDPERLSSRPAFTLRALYERGASWLEPGGLAAPFRGVTIVGCEADDGARVSIRSPHALVDLLDRRSARGGYLVRVTLRFETEGGETTDATLELPNKLTIADPRFDDAIRAALDALRFTSPGVLADDLESLASLDHAAWRWVEVTTPAGFERAVAAGLLARAASSRRASDAAHRSYGSSLLLHPIPGEATKYALGEDLSVHAYDVSPEATVRWKLDVPRFAASLRARLSLEEPRLKREPPAALLPIGVLEAKGATIQVFQSMRPVHEAEAGDLREALRLACGTSIPVVLVGKGRTLGKGTAQVEVEPARLFDGDGLGDVMAGLAEAVGVEDDLDGWRFATGNEPLVLQQARGEAWFERVRLRVTTNQLAMLLALAKTPTLSMDAAELGERISPNATIVDQIARKTRVGFDERIARSFEDAGIPMPEGLPQRILAVDKGRGGYRLGVGVLVR